MQELLEKAGLTDKEAALYLGLLKYGTRTTSFLAGKVGLNRGTTYVAMHSLLAKGLVVKTTKRGAQHFTAHDPRQLLEHLNNQIHSLSHVKTTLEDRMEELTALVNPLTSRPKFEYFEGIEGARHVMTQTLFSKEKTLRAFLSITDLVDLLGLDFVDRYTSQRIEKDYSLNLIRTYEKDREAIERLGAEQLYLPNPKEKRTVHYVPEGLSFPVTMFLFDDKVAILSSPEEKISLLIESRHIAEMQKKLFDLLWASTGVQMGSQKLKVLLKKRLSKSSSIGR